MNSLWPTLAPVLSLGMCVLVLAVLLRRTSRLPMDHPNMRSLHSAPTPRIGGLGILAGIATGFMLLGMPGTLALAFPIAGLGLISLFDDYFNLSARIRLLTHMAASGLFLALAPSLGWVGSFVVFFLIVWMSNLYNFMDGANGLAGGMALFGFATYALLAGIAGDIELATLCAIVAAAAVGFLFFNFPVARCFMGDAGSIPLGFLVAAVGVLGWQRELWPWGMPLLLFSPFIIDASLTLLRRGVAGERVWLAHRDHYYQRLVRMGWSHRRLALAEYAVMSAAAGSCLLLAIHPDWWIGVAMLWAALYLALANIIDRRWKESVLVH